MLILVFLLCAGGLIALAYLVIMFCENVLPAAGAIVAVQLALHTGGGWPAAIVSGICVFAALSIALRLGFALAPAWPVRLGLIAIVAAPAANCAYILADAVLNPAVPSFVWRTLLASLASVLMAAGAVRKLVALRTAA